MGAAFFVGTYIHEVPTQVRGSDRYGQNCVLYHAERSVRGERCGRRAACRLRHQHGGVIASAKAFALTVIDQTADMLYIGNFGFRTSSDYDKFAKYETRETALGMPYVPEHAAALFSCRLIDTVDVGTHLLFIGEVEDAERLSDETPLTYDYYHKVLKGKTPPKASSYQG